MQVVVHAPVYVWFLLLYLLWSGWKSRKTRIVSWKLLLIIPAFMFIWSIYAMITRYDSLSICFWAVSIAMGFWLGSLTVRRLKLRFDKQRHLIEIPGSWIPMMLSVSIFSLRYVLGAIYGLHPELSGNSALLVLENIATIVSGMFTGRLIGYWRRSIDSSHSELVGLNE